MQYDNSIIINLWRHGLGVRMYLIVSYLAYARDQGKDLVGLWKNNVQCPGNFCDIFEPINGCQILDNKWEGLSSRLPKGSKSIHMLEGYYPFQHFHLYSLFRPVKPLQDKISTISTKLGDYISIHVRRTDMEHLSKNQNSFVQYGDFFDFIDSHPTSLKIYLASDNKDSQDVFLSKYGDRVYINERLNLKYDPKNPLKRATLLDGAIIDMFVCSKARHFKGSNKSSTGTGISSFSGAIQYLYNLNQKND